MGFKNNKTKIICTIGPASESQEVMEKMLLAGMDVARLNFSHGNFNNLLKNINSLRAASKKTNKRLAILGDLSGPKIRIGNIKNETIELKTNDNFILTTKNIIGDKTKVSVSFKKLPKVVQPNDILHLNDGFIQIKVINVTKNEVRCKVIVGGELRSKKGLNLPGIKLGISAFTKYDKTCLGFAAKHNLDAISQSFVESDKDIKAVRAAAQKLNYNPFIIAKIERAGALKNIDNIMESADGIMVARGDLGVEVPIEKMAIIQKQLIEQARFLGKPVITATQMLESMIEHKKPTRAEATDVANAILDGTDCVMLSGESAIGKYPVESVDMLAKIAAVTEPNRKTDKLQDIMKIYHADKEITLTNIITLGLETIMLKTTPTTVIVPTMSGATARNIARFRSDVWVTAVSPRESTCNKLQFSYGIHPVYEGKYQEDWNSYTKAFLKLNKIQGKLAILIEGPSSVHPENNHRMEFIELNKK